MSHLPVLFNVLPRRPSLRCALFSASQWLYAAQQRQKLKRQAVLTELQPGCLSLATTRSGTVHSAAAPTRQRCATLLLSSTPLTPHSAYVLGLTFSDFNCSAGGELTTACTSSLMHGLWPASAASEQSIALYVVDRVQCSPLLRGWLRSINASCMPELVQVSLQLLLLTAFRARGVARYPRTHVGYCPLRSGIC